MSEAWEKKTSKTKKYLYSLLPSAGQPESLMTMTLLFREQYL